MVGAAAARLAGLGVARGERIALLLPTSPAYVALLFAALRAGVVACPLSLRLPPPVAAEQARELGAVLVVTDDGARIGPVPGARVASPGDLVPADAEAARGVVDGPVPLDPEAPATMLYTSGSSGRPKAALLSWANHFYSAAGANANIPLRPGARWLLSLPLYHVGGMAILFRCVLGGAAVVLPGVGVPAEAAVGWGGISHVSLVATQLRRLLAGPVEGRSGLEAVLLGGSALPEELVARAVREGMPVHTSYGMTEMGSQVTATPPGADLDALRSSGSLLPYRELRVAPDGEIHVRGATRFLGYWREGGLEQPFDADGWFATGDLGALDTRGRLHVTGRKDRLFISGGENIQPEEIEAALGQLDGVAGAFVVPVPDREFGARPAAFVRTAGEGFDEAALREGLARRIARFKIPVAFYPWPDELGGEMKPDRGALQRLAVERLHGGGRP